MGKDSNYSATVHVLSSKFGGYKKVVRFNYTIDRTGNVEVYIPLGVLGNEDIANTILDVLTSRTFLFSGHML